MTEEKTAIYKLTYDKNIDKDIDEWLGKLPRNKKAEVVRHALRYYMSQLKEGEVFIMPSSTASKETVATPIMEEVIKKRPKAGMVNQLTHITKVDQG